jgi:hypothetical protein
MTHGFLHWSLIETYNNIQKLEFVFLLYRFRFISLDFVSYFTDFVSFRWISFSYFTDFVGFCFRFVSFRFSVYRYPLTCLSVTVLLTCITRNSIQAGFACRQTFRSSNVIFLFVLSVCQYLWIIKFLEWAYNEICKVRKRNPTKWNEICKVRNEIQRNETKSVK